jgi:hypothetical protein
VGILAPLFMAGLAGLALPIVFHLVRRTPRGRQDFSSLMFLAPTPPRLTRRSRLDQVFLLLLRLGALALLAFAFARPFLRETSLLSLNDLPRRRVAILLDASASMRRGDLWSQAMAQVQKELDELAPHDDVALFMFSDRLETVVGFNTESKIAGAAPVEVVRQRLSALKPTWATSNLGAAISSLAAELDASSDVQQSLAEPQLVVIGDFQQGSRLDALQGFVWPQRVRVVARPLALRQTTNATLQLLASDEAAPDEEPRVRVVNAADSKHDQFFLSWQDQQRPASAASEVAVYVPPGQSRVMKLPRPANQLFADRIVLRGDDQDFDNTYYVVPPRQQTITLAYFGSDAADDPQGCQYYLRLATTGDPLRQVLVTVSAGDDTTSLTQPVAPQLAVVTKTLSTAQQAQLKTYVERGGTLVLVATDRSAAAALPQLFEGVELGPEPPEPTRQTEKVEGNFNLLGEIDFTHPLFAPLSNPRYNDFTRIHFWRRQPVQVKPSESTRVVARFDNGEAWLLERSLGKGRIWALTSGWQPDDSQLAVSSKFVPLVGNLLDQACGVVQVSSSTVVNAPVALPRQRPAKLVVRSPDGEDISLKNDATDFSATAQPGICRVGEGPGEFRFAVNLAASESDTAPLPLEQLEQLGVRLAADVTRAERVEHLRQERDAELESRQQVWRWLLVGCLGVLIVETWWAGRASRAADKITEAVG